MGAETQDTPLQRACRDTQLSDADLWLRYFALGGTAMPQEVREVVGGTREPDPVEYTVMVQAINERYMELHRRERLPYTRKHGTG